MRGRASLDRLAEYLAAIPPGKLAMPIAAAAPKLKTTAAFGGTADIDRRSALIVFDATDPRRQRCRRARGKLLSSRPAAFPSRKNSGQATRACGALVPCRRSAGWLPHRSLAAA